jgi:uncharacterized OsmC-like protein
LNNRTALDALSSISMKADELRAMQAPLKERYKSDPDSATVTLRASGKLGEAIACNVATGRALVEAGLHPATGGSGMLACSGDMLLEALAACAGVTLRAVATAIEAPVSSGEVLVEGDVDFRGTLGVAKEAPVGFKDIRVRILVDGSPSDEQLAALAKLTQRYCVVYQSLRSTPSLTVERR